MSEAEPIFYLARLGRVRRGTGRRSRAARATTVTSTTTASAATSTHATAAARRRWHAACGSWKIGARQLESGAGARHSAQRELLASKLVWLEDKVRTLAAVSSRSPVASTGIGAGATPVPPLSLLLLLLLPISTNTFANPRPRSQYEHAPRRDHAFNRQPLPPPPPPIGQQRCRRCPTVSMTTQRLLTTTTHTRSAPMPTTTTPVRRFPPRRLTAMPISPLVSVRFSPTLIDCSRKLAVPLDSAAANDVDVRDDDVDDQHEDEFEALRSRVMLERDLLSQMHATRQPRRSRKAAADPSSDDDHESDGSGDAPSWPAFSFCSIAGEPHCKP
jgi:hypothetical protein